MNERMQPTRQRSLAPLVILVVIFALPIIAAWFLYLNPEYLPLARSNRGELVDPPRPVGDLALSTLAGESVPLKSLATNWTMVQVTDAPCDAACVEHLQEFRQIRLALADNRYRSQRLLILAGDAAAANAGDIGDMFPNTLVLSATGEQLSGLEQLFSDLPDPFRNGRFLIDPMGNLMMSYSPDAPPEDLLNDLETLFKASKNWIKGAQYGHK